MASFRVLADNNVVASGFLWDGPSARVIRSARVGLLQLVTTEEMLSELENVLRDAYLVRRVQASTFTPETLAATFRSMSEVVRPAPAILSAVRDRDDTIVIAAAVGGDADIVVTGDKDLLALGSHGLIAILTPV